MTAKADSSPSQAVIHGKLVVALQDWQDAEFEAAESKHSFTKDTMLRLPNLRHVEHALSTYYLRFIDGILSEIRDRTRHDLQPLCYPCLSDSCIFATISIPDAFTEGFKLIFQDLPDTITSLKLRNVALSQPYPSDDEGLSATLQHLDLELRVPEGWDNKSKPYGSAFVEAWRRNLIHLLRLKTLRLSFEDGQGGATDYDCCVEPKYIDDLLIDPTDDGKFIVFPHLRSLALTNCSLRICEFLAFAAAQSPTLKKLELSRVTFDPSYCPSSWSEIAATCKNAVPNLTYLRLAKLITHFARRADAPVEEHATPERWNRGLEAETAYEWCKRIHGPDVEVKGSKCPWEAEDVIVEEECKRNFNGDRYWFYTEKERALRA
ncbi:MAG: hypothetical protein ASARMPRED_007446 [Alectoria sarmentosa]|nr:MAG: hypothetical protein ASARMPRED_007446 [Alectoria sarmentosa]